MAYLKGAYQNENQHYQNEDQIIHETPLYSATVQTSLRLGVFVLSFLVFRC